MYQQVFAQQGQTQFAAAGDNLYQDDGQHIGHRVVTSAFQFQHGTQVFLQVHFLRAQQAEDRGRIGRRHGGGQQQGSHQGQFDVGTVPFGQKEDETTGQQGREQDSYRRKDDTGCQYRFDILILGVHTAGEQDDTQRHHTDELGIFGTVELETQPVAAEEHTYQEEQEQGRDTEAVAGLADENTREDKYRAYQKDVFCRKNHRLCNVDV